MKKFKQHIKSSTDLSRKIIADPNKYYPEFRKKWDLLLKYDKELYAINKRIDWDLPFEPDHPDSIEYDRVVELFNDVHRDLQDMCGDLPGYSVEVLGDAVTARLLTTDPHTLWKKLLGEKYKQ